MSERAELTLSFGAGEDHVSHETRIPEGFARRVVNFDLDNTGVGHQRRKLEQLMAAGDCHSAWQSPDTGVVYAVVGARLSKLVGGVFEPLTWYLGGDVVLSSVKRAYFARVNDVIYYTNGDTHGTIRSDGFVHPLGVVNPASRTVVAGGDVRYVTYQNTFGEESGAVRFDQGTPPAMTGHVVRLYSATEESDLFHLDGDRSKRVLKTQGKVRMPPGRHLEFLAGRLFTVRGRRVYYSEPMNYGLTDPRYNFVDVGSYVTMIAAVENGLYVGTKDELIFYSGTDPRDWTMQRMLAKPVLPGGVCRVPATALPQGTEVREGERYALAVLSPDGIIFCLGGGFIVTGQKARVKFPVDTEVIMDLVERDGYYQVIAIPRSYSGSASREAADLTVEVDDD